MTGAGRGSVAAYVVGDAEYLRRFRRYLDELFGRLVAWTQHVDSLPAGARPHVCAINYDLDAASGYVGTPGR